MEPRQRRKTKLCWHFQRSETCSHGDKCVFAHGEQELQQAPDFTKTTWCRQFRQTGYCENLSCPFVHTKREPKRTKLSRRTAFKSGSEESTSTACDDDLGKTMSVSQTSQASLCSRSSKGSSCCSQDQRFPAEPRMQHQVEGDELLTLGGNAGAGAPWTPPSSFTMDLADSSCMQARGSTPLHAWTRNDGTLRGETRPTTMKDQQEKSRSEQAESAWRPKWPAALFQCKETRDKSEHAILHAMRFYANCHKDDLAIMLQEAGSRTFVD